MYSADTKMVDMELGRVRSTDARRYTESLYRFSSTDTILVQHSTLLTFDPNPDLYMMVSIQLAYYCGLLIRSPRMDGVCCYYMQYFETLRQSGGMLVVM